MAEKSTKQASGSCLCGKVTYTLAGEPITTVVCHCNACQKSSGSCFQSNVMFKADQFRLVSGANEVKAYHDTSADSGRTVIRSFCGSCGSNVYINSTNPGLKDITIINSGCVDGEARGEFVPKQEYYNKERRSWVKIEGSQQRFERMV